MPAPSSDRDWLMQAIELSRLCPSSQAAFSVGAIIVDGDGQEMPRGYSRESALDVHAEEAALAELDELALLAQGANSHLLGLGPR